MATTLRDVAALAGVSESTASRALSNSPLVSETTRQTVLAAARKIGYRTAKTPVWPNRIIGVLEPSVTNPLYAEIVAAIESRAYKAGYSIILCDSAFDPQREQGQLDLLMQQGVSGLVITPIDPAAEHIRALIDHDIPCVILGTDPILGADQVNVDVAMGAYLATRHLLELGHRQIAVIRGPARVSACEERLSGYRRALAEREVPYDPDKVVQGDLDENGGAAAMARLLPRVPHDITAVYAINDAMAIGALRVLREAGLHVPQEVSLIGCDDIPVAAQLQPALTTVWQPKRELGYLAAKLILKQIETQQERGNAWRQEYPFQSAMYLPRVVVRDSTASLNGAAV